MFVTRFYIFVSNFKILSDDVFQDPETPQHHSFLSKFKRHSVTSYISSRRQSAQETIKESNQEEEEHDYLKQLAEFDKKRLRLNSHGTVTETPQEEEEQQQQQQPASSTDDDTNKIINNNNNVTKNNNTGYDDGDQPVSPTLTIKTTEPPPSIIQAAVESEESASTKYYPDYSTKSISPPLSPKATGLPTPPPPPLMIDESDNNNNSNEDANNNNDTNKNNETVLKTAYSMSASLHKPTPSQSTVSSQTPSVSSSILFPQNDSSLNTSPSLFSMSSFDQSSDGKKSILDDNDMSPTASTKRKLTKIERLQKEIDGLQDSSRSLKREISLLDPVLNSNPYMYSKEQREKTKEQYDDLQNQLSRVEKQRHDIGLKLSRAWKKQRDIGTAVGSYWVHSNSIKR